MPREQRLGPDANSEAVKPTFEDIQLCVENYRRLYDDSLKVSDPTSAALIELSLEELAKAWNLYFAYIGRKMSTDVSFVERFTKTFFKGGVTGFQTKMESQEAEVTERMKEFFDRNGKRLFESPFTVTDFRDHHEKLKYLGLVIEYLRLMTPILGPLADSRKLSELLLGRYTAPERISKTTFRTGLKPFAGVNTDFVSELEVVKEKGFYVDYRNGMYISPTVATPTIRAWREVFEALDIGLRSSLRILTNMLES